uniref:Uncharacterized protein n=1 Tax=Timema shepardi TaxID=629360 RepID=A0A7R9ATP2_TIMSH|nr:unnamed protein product [Timema shepardi]
MPGRIEFLVHFTPILHTPKLPGEPMRKQEVNDELLVVNPFESCLVDNNYALIGSPRRTSVTHARWVEIPSSSRRMPVNFYLPQRLQPYFHPLIRLTTLPLTRCSRLRAMCTATPSLNPSMPTYVSLSVSLSLVYRRTPFNWGTFTPDSIVPPHLDPTGIRTKSSKTVRSPHEGGRTPHQWSRRQNVTLISTDLTGSYPGLSFTHSFKAESVMDVCESSAIASFQIPQPSATLDKVERLSIIGSAQNGRLLSELRQACGCRRVVECRTI